MAQWQHRTRSGKVFRHEDCQQTSSWGVISELLQTVLPAYLNFEGLLKCRRVCQAWRTCFSPHVQQLQLQQPTSARSAVKMGRKAAAAFSKATTLRLFLHDIKDFAIDLTTDGTTPDIYGPESLGHPAAAAALLRQLQKGGKVQHLQLWKMPQQACTFLPRVVQAAPQLHVLDLSCCPHPPADLHVLAQHTPLLQELLLHCQVSTTLSDRRISKWKPSMRYFGGVSWAAHNQAWRQQHDGRTCYGHEHIAALAKLPHLQLLECPLPHGYSTAQFTQWFTALATLTSLTGLQLVRQWHSARPPASAVQALSSLTNLQRLRCDVGIAVGSSRQSAQEHCWGAVLPCMTRLTRLELLHVWTNDALLRVIGSNSPQLKHLLLVEDCFGGQCSKEGADAIEHVPRIELFCSKGMECKDNLPLFQLPGVKRVQWRHALSFEREDDCVDAVWTQDTCRCWSCCVRQNRR